MVCGFKILALTRPFGIPQRLVGLWGGRGLSVQRAALLDCTGQLGGGKLTRGICNLLPIPTASQNPRTVFLDIVTVVQGFKKEIRGILLKSQVGA